MSKKEILKNSLKLGLMTFMSRIMGLVREQIRANFLGTTALSDCFTIAFLLPNLLRKLFAEGSVAVAFVPVLKGYLLKENKEIIKEFLSATFTVISFLVTLTVIIGIFSSDLLINVFYSDLTPEIKKETIFLTKAMFPYLAFISIAAFFQGILNSVKIFSPSGFVPVLFNGSIILSTLIFSSYFENPARAMALGVIFGGSLQAIFQLPYVLKTGYRFGFQRIRKSFKNPGTRRILIIVGPTILGMAAYEVNVLVSSVIATTAGTGVVSSLQYSNRLLELILGILAVSLGTVILTELSGNAKKGEWEKFSSNLVFAIDLTAILTIPVTIFSIINSTEIIRLIFKFGTFNDNSVTLTALIFTFHILGLCFIAANRIIAPAFYAQENSKTPTYAGIFSVAVNLLFCYLLVTPLKGGGIAIAATISSCANTIFLFTALSKNKNMDAVKIVLEIVKYSGKLISVIALVSIPFYYLKPYIYGLFSFSESKWIATGIPFCIAAFIYFSSLILIAIVLKDKQITFALNAIRRKIKS